MKQGVEKPHSDTQGQFCSTATQSKLPLLCQKTKQIPTWSNHAEIWALETYFYVKGFVCLKHNITSNNNDNQNNNNINCCVQILLN